MGYQKETDNSSLQVVRPGRAFGAADVETYHFPAELHPPHGLIDVREPDQNVAVVHPKLLELIDR